jgi:hypothetical protein
LADSLAVGHRNVRCPEASGRGRTRTGTPLAREGILSLPRGLFRPAQGLRPTAERYGDCRRFLASECDRRSPRGALGMEGLWRDGAANPTPARCASSRPWPTPPAGVWARILPWSTANRVGAHLSPDKESPAATGPPAISAAATLAFRRFRRRVSWATDPGAREAKFEGKSGHNPLNEANSLPRLSGASPVPGEGLIRAPNRA